VYIGSLGGHGDANHMDGLNQGAPTDDVKHMGRKNREVGVVAAFEGGETSEQTSGPNDRFRKGKVAKRRQTACKDGWDGVP